MNGGHRHRTPPHATTLALYRLADHEHEVISTPEADGIALLYSNSPGRGGRVPLCALFFLKWILLSFHFCPLQTPQKPLAQQSRCISHLIQSTFIPWLSHFNPFFLLSLSLLPAPSPSPHSLRIHRVRSAFKDRESCDWNWIDTSASFAMHCIMRLT